MPYPPPRTTWPGQTHEFHELVDIVKRNCSDPKQCAFRSFHELCGAHQMLIDQRVLDGLVFERHDGVRLVREEGLLL